MNNIKFTSAQQSIKIYQYKDIREKLHNTNAAIWFNIKCVMVNLVLCCNTLPWFRDDGPLRTETRRNIQCDIII